MSCIINIPLINPSPLDTRMNLRKLLTSAVFVLGAWMSVGVASAQDTAYTFNFYSGGGAMGGAASGTYQYQVQLLANSATGTVDNFTYLAAGPTGNLTDYSSIIVPVDGAVSTGTVKSATDYNFQVGYLQSGYSVGQQALWVKSSGIDYGPAGFYGGQVSGFVSTGGKADFFAPLAVGAPEIDGSLAPKVGFLLGCLFLMFGRKKQVAEPMMTA